MLACYFHNAPDYNSGNPQIIIIRLPSSDANLCYLLFFRFYSCYSNVCHPTSIIRCQSLLPVSFVLTAVTATCVTRPPSSDANLRYLFLSFLQLLQQHVSPDLHHQMPIFVTCFFRSYSCYSNVCHPTSIIRCQSSLPVSFVLTAVTATCANRPPSSDANLRYLFLSFLQLLQQRVSPDLRHQMSIFVACFFRSYSCYSNVCHPTSIIRCQSSLPVSFVLTAVTATCVTRPPSSDANLRCLFLSFLQLLQQRVPTDLHHQMPIFVTCCFFVFTAVTAMCVTRPPSSDANLCYLFLSFLQLLQQRVSPDLHHQMPIFVTCFFRSYSCYSNVCHPTSVIRCQSSLPVSFVLTAVTATCVTRPPSSDANLRYLFLSFLQLLQQRVSPDLHHQMPIFVACFFRSYSCYSNVCQPTSIIRCQSLLPVVFSFLQLLQQRVSPDLRHQMSIFVACFFRSYSCYSNVCHPTSIIRCQSSLPVSFVLTAVTATCVTRPPSSDANLRCLFLSFLQLLQQHVPTDLHHQMPIFVTCFFRSYSCYSNVCHPTSVIRCQSSLPVSFVLTAVTATCVTRPPSSDANLRYLFLSFLQLLQQHVSPDLHHQMPIFVACFFRSYSCYSNVCQPTSIIRCQSSLHVSFVLTAVTATCVTRPPSSDANLRCLFLSFLQLLQQRVPTDLHHQMPIFVTCFFRSYSCYSNVCQPTSIIRCQSSLPVSFVLTAVTATCVTRPPSSDANLRCLFLSFLQLLQQRVPTDLHHQMPIFVTCFFRSYSCYSNVCQPTSIIRCQSSLPVSFVLTAVTATCVIRPPSSDANLRYLFLSFLQLLQQRVSPDLHHQMPIFVTCFFRSYSCYSNVCQPTSIIRCQSSLPVSFVLTAVTATCANRPPSSDANLRYLFLSFLQLLQQRVSTDLRHQMPIFVTCFFRFYSCYSNVCQPTSIIRCQSSLPVSFVFTAVTATCVTRRPSSDANLRYLFLSFLQLLQQRVPTDLHHQMPIFVTCFFRSYSCYSNMCHPTSIIRCQSSLPVSFVLTAVTATCANRPPSSDANLRYLFLSFLQLLQQRVPTDLHHQMPIFVTCFFRSYSCYSNVCHPTSIIRCQSSLPVSFVLTAVTATCVTRPPSSDANLRYLFLSFLQLLQQRVSPDLHHQMPIFVACFFRSYSCYSNMCHPTSVIRCQSSLPVSFVLTAVTATCANRPPSSDANLRYLFLSFLQLLQQRVSPDLRHQMSIFVACFFRSYSCYSNVCHPTSIIRCQSSLPVSFVFTAVTATCANRPPSSDANLRYLFLSFLQLLQQRVPTDLHHQMSIFVACFFRSYSCYSNVCHPTSIIRCQSSLPVSFVLTAVTATCVTRPPSSDANLRYLFLSFLQLLQQHVSPDLHHQMPIFVACFFRSYSCYSNVCHPTSIIRCQSSLPVSFVFTAVTATCANRPPSSDANLRYLFLSFLQLLQQRVPTDLHHQMSIFVACFFRSYSCYSNVCHPTSIIRCQSSLPVSFVLTAVTATCVTRPPSSDANLRYLFLSFLQLLQQHVSPDLHHQMPIFVACFFRSYSCYSNVCHPTSIIRCQSSLPVSFVFTAVTATCANRPPSSDANLRYLFLSFLQLLQQRVPTDLHHQMSIFVACFFRSYSCYSNVCHPTSIIRCQSSLPVSFVLTAVTGTCVTRPPSSDVNLRYLFLSFLQLLQQRVPTDLHHQMSIFVACFFRSYSCYSNVCHPTSIIRCQSSLPVSFVLTAVTATCVTRPPSSDVNLCYLFLSFLQLLQQHVSPDLHHQMPIFVTCFFRSYSCYRNMCHPTSVIRCQSSLPVSFVLTAVTATCVTRPPSSDVNLCYLFLSFLQLLQQRVSPDLRHQMSIFVTCFFRSYSCYSNVCQPTSIIRCQSSLPVSFVLTAVTAMCVTRPPSSDVNLRYLFLSFLQLLQEHVSPDLRHQMSIFVTCFFRSYSCYSNVCQPTSIIRCKSSLPVSFVLTAVTATCVTRPPSSDANLRYLFLSFLQLLQQRVSPDLRHQMSIFVTCFFRSYSCYSNMCHPTSIIRCQSSLPVSFVLTAVTGTCVTRPPSSDVNLRYLFLSFLQLLQQRVSPDLRHQMSIFVTCFFRSYSCYSNVCHPTSVIRCQSSLPVSFVLTAVTATCVTRPPSSDVNLCYLFLSFLQLLQQHVSPDLHHQMPIFVTCFFRSYSCYRNMCHPTSVIRCQSSLPVSFVLTAVTATCVTRPPSSDANLRYLFLSFLQLLQQRVSPDLHHQMPIFVTCFFRSYSCYSNMCHPTSIIRCQSSLPVSFVLTAVTATCVTRPPSSDANLRYLFLSFLQLLQQRVPTDLHHQMPIVVTCFFRSYSCYSNMCHPTSVIRCQSSLPFSFVLTAVTATCVIRPP